MSDAGAVDGFGGAGIDPRIRARRIEVRRREGRQRLQRLVEVGLVLGVALLFVGALWTPLLDVDGVEVTGLRHLDPGAVLAAAAVDPGSPLVGVDVGAVGARVAELPWVAEVQVDRGIDGTVRLAVTERTPAGVVAAPGGALVVDAEGRVLGPVAEVAEAGPLIAIEGAGTAPPVGGYLPAGAQGALAVAARLVTDAPGAVVAIHVEDLVATLAQGGTVRFADATRLDAKVRSLRTVLEQVDLVCLDRIDLALPGSPVLTREEGCS